MMTGMSSSPHEVLEVNSQAERDWYSESQTYASLVQERHRHLQLILMSLASGSSSGTTICMVCIY